MSETLYLSSLNNRKSFKLNANHINIFIHLIKTGKSNLNNFWKSSYITLVSETKEGF